MNTEILYECNYCFRQYKNVFWFKKHMFKKHKVIINNFKKYIINKNLDKNI